MKTTPQEEKAQETLKFLKNRAEAIIAERKDINKRWIVGVSAGLTGYDSHSLTIWRNAILQTEKDLAEISHRIQTVNELFPTVK